MRGVNSAEMFDSALPPAPGEFVPLAEEPPPMPSRPMAPSAAMVRAAPEWQALDPAPAAYFPPAPATLPSFGSDAAFATPPAAADGGVVREGEQSTTALGLTILAWAAGAVVGGVLMKGGAVGAMGGLLVSSALVNAARAASNATKGTPEADKDAIVSGTYMLGGGALGVYLLVKAHQEAKAAERASEGEDEGEDDEQDEDEGGSLFDHFRTPPIVETRARKPRSRSRLRRRTLRRNSAPSAAPSAATDAVPSAAPAPTPAPTPEAHAPAAAGAPEA